MKIGIVALGLIGGSILKSLSLIKNKNIELIAISQNQNTLNEIKCVCSKCSSDLTDLAVCDVVFVCTPISKTLETLDILENILPATCIVTDVASVKEFVTAKTRNYKFIGSHPMAGLETSGFSAAIPTLFEGAKWVLTPNNSTEQVDIDFLTTIIELMGASVVIADAKEHDKAVALISHLPMLIAQSLFKNAANDSLALNLAASGFRDTTRLAMTNSSFAEDMLAYNRHNIAEALNSFLNTTNELFVSTNYRESLTEIIDSRKNLYSKLGKNIYNSNN